MTRPEERLADARAGMAEAGYLNGARDARAPPLGRKPPRNGAAASASPVL